MLQLRSEGAELCEDTRHFCGAGLERGAHGLRLLLGEQAQILGLSQGKEDVVVPALLTALLGESSASASRRNLTP